MSLVKMTPPLSEPQFDLLKQLQSRVNFAYYVQQSLSSYCIQHS